MAVRNAKCFQLFVLLAEKTQLFLSNRLVTNLCIAASVLYPNHVTTGKSLIVETFVGLSAWEGFFVCAREESISLERGSRRRGRVTALGVCQQNIHPCEENVLRTPVYFMLCCPWCVSEHILNPLT